MAIVNITRKAEVLKAFQLTSPDDMSTALQAIATGGFWGHIQHTRDGVWMLAIQSPNGSVSLSAGINDYLIMKNNFSEVEVATPAQFAAMYQ